MGIAGLHGFLKSIQKPCNVKKFAGQTLGVDGYGWLHRATVSCAYELALGRPTTKYVDFAMGRVRMLQHHGVTPYIVFDGGMLPSKEHTEAARASRREESKKLGEEHMRRGRAAEAFQEFQKAVDVTPYMARVLIEELKKHKIPYLVAPYEADPQLVYLEKQGIIHGIISEDSDMLVFGAKRLLSKLDKHGDCVEINRGDFAACRDVSLIGWTDETFRHMCILSGCDYLANIPKMGLKTAYRSMRKHKSVDRVVKMLQFEGTNRVPPGYLEDFKRAELTFLHQRLFCPTARHLVMLNPLSDGGNGEDMPFIGAMLEPEVAIGIACGDIDPLTKEPIVLRSSYPERERLVRTGRQSLTSSTEKKPVREIREFFTPKRVPLAELEPNSMTPSPRPNQPLIARPNRYSLAANRVSTPPSVVRSASSIPNTPLDRARRTEAFLGQASEIRPPPSVQKRQRLCSESDDDGSMIGVSSPYFASPGDPATVRRENSTKKLKSHKLFVFSDQNGAPVPPLDQTSNAHQTKQQSTVAENTSQLSPSTVSSREESTNDRSVDVESDSSLFKKVLHYNIERHNKSLVEKFAFKTSAQTSESDTTQPEAPVPTPAPSLLPGKSIKRTLSSQFRGTPLQRLKQSALARSKSMNNLQPLNLQPAVLPAQPESRPPEPTDRSSLAERKSKSPDSQIGSEDFMFPSSDDWGNEEEEEGESQDTAYSFDLSKYTFKEA